MRKNLIYKFLSLIFVISILGGIVSYFIIQNRAEKYSSLPPSYICYDSDRVSKATLVPGEEDEYIDEYLAYSRGEITKIEFPNYVISNRSMVKVLDTLSDGLLYHVVVSRSDEIGYTTFNRGHHLVDASLVQRCPCDQLCEDAQ